MAFEWTETVMPDGRGRRKLGDFTVGSWATSGRSLVGTTPDGLVLADHRGRVLRTLPRPIGPDGLPLYFGGPQISPDGRTVAFVSEVVHPKAQPEIIIPWIWTVRTDGTQLRRLAMGTRPRWMPGGRRIVFQPNDGYGSDLGIALMRRDGRHKRQLVSENVEPRLLDLAPGGRRLLWWGTHRPRPDRRSWVSRLVTSDLRGRNPKLISYSFALSAGWSPDGNKVVLAADDVGMRGTFIASATGGKKRRLLRRPRFGLTWQPRR
jgi:Tol biopolymer transport system component